MLEKMKTLANLINDQNKKLQKNILKEILININQQMAVNIGSKKELKRLIKRIEMLIIDIEQNPILNCMEVI